MLAGQCPASFWYQPFKKEVFSQTAHWVLAPKSGMNDLKKCMQVKKRKNIWNENHLLNVSHNYRVSDRYAGNQLRMLTTTNTLWIFNSFATNASWCIQWKTEEFIDVIKPVIMNLSSGLHK